MLSNFNIERFGKLQDFFKMMTTDHLLPSLLSFCKYRTSCWLLMVLLMLHLRMFSTVFGFGFGFGFSLQPGRGFPKWCSPESSWQLQECVSLSWFNKTVITRLTVHSTAVFAHLLSDQVICIMGTCCSASSNTVKARIRKITRSHLFESTPNVLTETRHCCTTGNSFESSFKPVFLYAFRARSARDLHLLELPVIP